jgi:hypothetical protein
VIAVRERGAGRHASRYVAVLLLSFVAACGHVTGTPEDRAGTVPRPGGSAVEAPAQHALVPEVERRDLATPDLVPRGSPVRLTIPAIAVDAVLVEVGLEADGAMEVPSFGSAGWYTEGPPPGHPGPSLIAAHVDSRAGPDVFHRLRELAPGDDVEVHYDSGDTVTFVVVSREQAPKEQLPGDRIWPVTADRLLTLITCGGEFDRSVRHYRDNIIVYTVLR